MHTLPYKEALSLLDQGIQLVEGQPDLPVWRVGVDTPVCETQTVSDPGITIGITNAKSRMPNRQLIYNTLQNLGCGEPTITNITLDKASHLAGRVTLKDANLWMYSPNAVARHNNFPLTGNLQRPPSTRVASVSAFIAELAMPVASVHVEVGERTDRPFDYAGVSQLPRADIAIACNGQEAFEHSLRKVTAHQIQHFEYLSEPTQPTVLLYRLTTPTGVVLNLQINHLQNEHP